MLIQCTGSMNTQVLKSEVIGRDSYMHKKLTLERSERPLYASTRPLSHHLRACQYRCRPAIEACSDDAVLALYIN